MTATVTKKNVSSMQKDLYAVTLTLTLFDGTTELLTKDFTEKYRTGQLISAINAKFVLAMQAEINRYKAEQAVYNHAQLATSITNITNALGL